MRPRQVGSYILLPLRSRCSHSTNHRRIRQQRTTTWIPLSIQPPCMAPLNLVTGFCLWVSRINHYPWHSPDRTPRRWRYGGIVNHDPSVRCFDTPGEQHTQYPSRVLPPTFLRQPHCHHLPTGCDKPCPFFWKRRTSFHAGPSDRRYRHFR